MNQEMYKKIVIPALLSMGLILAFVSSGYGQKGISEAACQARAGRLMKIVENWTQKGHPVSYDVEAFWKALGPEVTYNKLTQYITVEDGVVKPIRSGYEVALYQRIKDFIVSSPSKKIGPNELLQMGLEVVGQGGRANLQMVFLTIHNVERILARPQQWAGGPITGDYGHPPTDPAYPILQDIRGIASTGGKTLPEIMNARRRPDGSVYLATWCMEALYNRETGPFQFQPGAINAEWNAGCHYYFWIGALARTTLGSAAIIGGIVGEIRAKKANNNEQQGVIEVSHFVCGSMMGSLAFSKRNQFLKK
jgi:hypothetical protein